MLALSVSALITVLIYNGTRDKRSANSGIKVEINGAPDEDGVIYAHEGVQYEIKITPTGNAENGFCVLEADNGAVYHTSQLTTHPTAQYGAKHSITIIIVCEDDARITLSEHWGVSIYYPEFSYNGVGSDYYIEYNDIPPS